MQIIPLSSLPRQIVTVQLGESVMRIEAWFQPSDNAWYISVESPPNSAVVTGRRVTLGTSLLPRHFGIGAMWCEDITGGTADPALDSWDKDHRLFYDAELDS